MIVIDLALVFIGIVTGWLITHLYSVSSTRDQRLVFRKLSDEITDAILSDQRNSLSVQDLNNLLNSKVLDKTSTEPLPYLACPKCGSEDLKKGQDYDTQLDEVSYWIRCKQCGWHIQTQWYYECQTAHPEEWPSYNIQ